MTIHALDKNFYIREIPVGYRDRSEGSISKLQTIPDGIRILKMIFQLLRDYKPLTIWVLFLQSVHSSGWFYYSLFWLNTSDRSCAQVPYYDPCDRPDGHFRTFNHHWHHLWCDRMPWSAALRTLSPSGRKQNLFISLENRQPILLPLSTFHSCNCIIPLFWL